MMTVARRKAGQGAARLSTRLASRRGLAPHARRLALEPLEARRLLSVGSAELELFKLSPALFVENQGQWGDPSVRHMHQGDGVNVAMTDSGPVFQVFRKEAAGDAAAADPNNPTAALPGQRIAPENHVTETTQFSVGFVGANQVSPVGLEQAETKFNYLVGGQENWHTDVSSYQVVAYQGLYDGIDLQTCGQRSHLKYEFHVAPGADYRQIQVRYAGIEGLSLAADGSLHVQLGNGWGEMVDDAPYIYQVIDGRQVAVAGRFMLLDASSYSFEISGDYDPAEALVIDPDLAWSTYLGGSNNDEGFGIAVDAARNAYVTGHTYSSNFPTTPGAYDTTYNGSDVFVAKVSATGSSLRL